jgi:hypothetical protein
VKNLVSLFTAFQKGEEFTRQIGNALLPAIQGIIQTKTSLKS